MRDEYPSLRKHYQLTREKPKTIIVGDVVQVNNEGKRLEWKLAIVESLIKIGDGLVRAATIKTAKRPTNRQICKLYPIEVVNVQENAAKAVIKEVGEIPKPTSKR